MERIREMMSALNDMLDADARGEHTPGAVRRSSWQQYGDFFPEQPQNLDELIDSLARRAAAAQRLMDTLTPEQRAELEALMGQAMRQSGLADEMARLQQGLRSARPDLRWGGRQRMDGDEPMGFADATGALAELADLDQLDELLGQDYPGASLDDIDEELIERALGRAAVDDMAQLRRIETRAARAGLPAARQRRPASSPRARCAGSARPRCKRVFAVLESRGRGGHDVRDAGAAGEITGASREWRFGDEQPLDVVRTVRNAVLRSAAAGDRASICSADDFEVVETERRSSAAVALLVDMSYSMELRGTWGEAKTTALALHSLISTKYPQDAIEIIGFSDYARVMTTGALVEHDWDRVQGTNLQHGLMLARRHLDKHRNSEPVILVITDGEPTAHLAARRLRRLRLAADAARRSPPRWPRSSAAPAAARRSTSSCSTTTRGWSSSCRRSAGATAAGCSCPSAGALGEFVVADYLRSRDGRRRAAG